MSPLSEEDLQVENSQHDAPRIAFSLNTSSFIGIRGSRLHTDTFRTVPRVLTALIAVTSARSFAAASNAKSTPESDPVSLRTSATMSVSSGEKRW